MTINESTRNYISPIADQVSSDLTAIMHRGQKRPIQEWTENDFAMVAAGGQRIKDYCDNIVHILDTLRDIKYGALDAEVDDGGTPGEGSV